MLRTETVSPELLNVLRAIMRMKHLESFRLVGGTALSLQLGHRRSIDIDLFTPDYFPFEEICKELSGKFQGKLSSLKVNEIMIRAEISEVKADIVSDKTPFIRDVVLENGIRMANVEEIAATKIKMVCDPFSGRKTKKDIVDIATLLDKFDLKQMIGFFKEKYPTMAPYEDNIIIRIKDFKDAEISEMPIMLNGLSWEKSKQKIENGFKDYFECILNERKLKLKAINKDNNLPES